MWHGTSELFVNNSAQTFYIKCKHWFTLKEIAFAEWGQECNANAKEFCPFSQAYYPPHCKMKFWSQNKLSLIHMEIYNTKRKEIKSSSQALNLHPDKICIFLWSFAYPSATLQITTNKTEGAIHLQSIKGLLGAQWNKMESTTERT